MVLRYIEGNPLRVGLAKRADDYRWSSYRTHGLGEPSELVNPLVTFDALSPLHEVRQRKWATIVHQPLADEQLDAIHRSNHTCLSYVDAP